MAGWDEVLSLTFSGGHRAASLLEDGLPGLEKWSDHIPCYCGPAGTHSATLPGEEDDRCQVASYPSPFLFFSNEKAYIWKE